MKFNSNWVSVFWRSVYKNFVQDLFLYRHLFFGYFRDIHYCLFLFSLFLLRFFTSCLIRVPRRLWEENFSFALTYSFYKISYSFSFISVCCDLDPCKLSPPLPQTPFIGLSMFVLVDNILSVSLKSSIFQRSVFFESLVICS